MLSPAKPAPLHSSSQAELTATRNIKPISTPDFKSRVALVIGNANYRQGPLVNPVNDARAIAGKLKDLGFDVLLKENMRTREIGSVYREFRSKIEPGGTALVFYAGHGVQFKGQNYFPAVDSEFSGEEDVPLQSLNLGLLLDNMEEAKAGVSLVFLDACRDNPFARRFRSASRGLAKVESASGTLIHYATKPGSVADDGDGRNGIYTEALLAQMGEPGVPVEQMLKRVTNRVVSKTKGKQEPWVEGSLRGDFYFDVQVSASLNNLPPPSDPDAEAWGIAQRANTEAGYRSYLNTYKNGRFAPAAMIAIDAMKKPTVVTDRQKFVVTPVPTSSPLHNASPRVELKTSHGTMIVELYPEQAPKSVENFLAYAKADFYSGTVFHRVIDGFMIQGGGFTPEMKEKAGRAPIPNEAKNGLKNEPGTLAMARTGDPHSATSQFFINLVNNSRLDYPSFDGWGYAVFGKVVSGMDVVKKIGKVATGNTGFHQNVPTAPVMIESIKLLSDKPAETAPPKGKQ